MSASLSKPFHFLPESDLPDGFKYPSSYIEFVRQEPDAIVGPVNEDWCFIDSTQIENFRKYVRKVSRRPLVPFMRRNGDDGVACFLAESPHIEPNVWIAYVFQDVGVWPTSKTFSEWVSSIPPRDEDDDR